MTFLWPRLLLTLLVVPLFIAGYIWLVTRQKRAADPLGPLRLVQDSSGNLPGKRRHIPPSLYLAGLSLLIFSLSRPEVFLDLPRIEGTVILAFDVSNSMAAEDFEPSRMEAAKTAAKTFVENQPGTIQLGVVAFSDGGLVVQPPTYDQVAILETINRLNPQGATSLGQGIFSALNAIVGEAIAIEPEEIQEGVPTVNIGNYSSAVILLFTDGENTSLPDPLDIAQIAAEAGIRIYPVGIGSTDGIVLDIDGYKVLTQLNEQALQNIAEVTNGAYYHANDEASLQEIYNTVDLRLTVSGEKMEVTAIIAGLSMLFFLMGGSLSLLWYGRIPL